MDFFTYEVNWKKKNICTPSGRLVAGEIWELNTRQNKDIQELFSEEELIVLGGMAEKLFIFLSQK